MRVLSFVLSLCVATLLLPAEVTGQAGSVRTRVLVAVFQPSQGVDGDFGEEIAEKIRTQVEDFDLLTAVSGDEVEDTLEQFHLKATDMPRVAWRQLASRLNAELIIYGDITRRVSADGYSVDAKFIDSNSGHTTSLPTVKVQDDGGDDAERVADNVSDHLNDQVGFLRARLNCQDYLSSDQLRDATRNCDRALSVRPENAPTLYLRGRIALEQENWDEAIGYLSQAVERSSSHEDALQSLAFAHAQAGNRDRSVKLYREYLESTPNAVDIWLTVAYNLASAGMFDGAEAILKQGLKKNPKNAELEEYLAQIKSSRTDQADTATDEERDRLQWTGTGDKSTEPFTVQRPGWEIAWRVKGDDMSSIRIHVNDAQTGNSVTSASSNGPGEDATYVYETGQFYLRVVSENASWIVQIDRQD